MKEDRCQLFVERGRTRAICQEREMRPFIEREDKAVHLEREDASAREGGCRPFVERGGTLAVHREREVAVH